MRNLSRFGCLMALIVVLSVSFVPASVQAEKWPTKQLNIVVPYGAGGTTDRIVRGLGPFLEKELGVPVVIINRKGGGGIVGTKAHLKNDPDDGSFILYNLQPYLSGAIAKDAFKLDDFDYLGMNYISPQGLFVRNGSNYSTAKQLFEDIRTKKITTSVVPNSWSRVCNALLEKRLGKGGKEIPYNGGGAMRMAVIRQDVVFTLTDLFGTISAVGEDLKPLAIFAEKRADSLPEVPTINEVMDEMGLSHIPDLNNFRFFMVKKSFRENYPNRWLMLEKALSAAVQNPEYIKSMAKQNIDISWKNAVQTGAKVRDADKVLQQFSYFWKK